MGMDVVVAGFSKVGVVYGLYRDKAKEHGRYYSGNRCA